MPFGFSLGTVNQQREVPLDLWSDIQAAWEFEGTTADSSGYWKDETGLNHLNVNYTGPVQGTGVRGNSRGVTASRQTTRAVGINNSSMFTTATDFTLLFWIWPYASTSYSISANLTPNPSNDAEHLICMTIPNVTNAVWELKNANGVTGQQFGDWTWNTWQHVALTYAHNDGVTVAYNAYLNGVPFGPFATNIPFVFKTGIQVWFNRSWFSGGGFGQIDMARIFHRELTPAEIVAHYNNGSGLLYLETP